MSYYSSPPDYMSWTVVKPSLIVCWWATLFSTVIIVLRVAGRFVRSERLFKEDTMAALALLPMYARMGCVQVILVYGTNNTDFEGLVLSEEELYRRRIGSGLVLASRIFYAATLWTLKGAILEFFQRLIGSSWSRSSQITLIAIRCILAATFLAIVVSDLAECRPKFSAYWQVVPDPGGQCRQGYANFLTTATCNIITDLLLVFFPIPIIITSTMRMKRKVQLTLLFSLSLAVVAVTVYRVTKVFEAHGDQQLRSLLASIEMLVATVAANALVLGSFVRDRGTKKHRYRHQSIAESADRTSFVRSGGASIGGGGGPLSASLSKPTLARAWGSDEDLLRDVGFGVHRDLLDRPDVTTPGGGHAGGQLQYTPAGPVSPIAARRMGLTPSSDWRRSHSRSPSDDMMTISEEEPPSPGGKSPNGGGLSFFDIGGLLESNQRASTQSRPAADGMLSPISSPPGPALTASGSGFRRGSQAFLQDIGGRRTKQVNHSPTTYSSTPRIASQATTELKSMPHSPSSHDYHPAYDAAAGGQTLNDVGGLLSSKK